MPGAEGGRHRVVLGFPLPGIGFAFCLVLAFRDHGNSPYRQDDRSGFTCDASVDSYILIKQALGAFGSPPSPLQPKLGVEEAF
eukprot:3313536-Prymnesium_polylepis.1